VGRAFPGLAVALRSPSGRRTRGSAFRSAGASPLPSAQGPGHLQRKAQRLGHPDPARRQHQRRGGLRSGPPGGVRHHRAEPGANPDPGGHHLPVEPERARRTGPILRHRALGPERPGGHAHRGKVEERPEHERQPGPPRVIAAGGVYQQHGRGGGEPAHHLLQQGPFPKRQLARGERGAGRAAARRRSGDPSLVEHHRRRPGRVARGPGPGSAAKRAHRAPAHGHREPRRLPGGWPGTGEPALQLGERRRAAGPARHE
jgi:hypothetical protein